MTLDDIASEAAEAVLKRGAQVASHPAGLQRKAWVAPAAVLGMVLLLAAGGLAINRVVRSEPDQVVAATVSVPGVQGPMLAAFVDGSGQITVLAGNPSSPEVLHLQARAGAPVLGDEVIPEPRWSVDGRVIEYVSRIDGQLKVVRVDVRTGLTSTEAYVARELPLMRGGVGPMVWASDSADEWRLDTFRDDESAQTLSSGSIQFLAPAPDGLVVLSDGELGLLGADLEQTELVIESVTAADVRSVASGPDSELAFGLEDGSVVVAGSAGTQAFDVGGAAVTGLAWDPSGASFLAQTSRATRVCTVATNECDAVEVAGMLVKGTPVPMAPEAFFGVWPESTASAADAATARDDAAPWRFDPQLLVGEYAAAVLGWPDPVVVAVDGPPFLPYQSAFEVGRSAEGPTVRIHAVHLAGSAGWVVTSAQSPISSFSGGYQSGGPVVIGFSREGAATVDVTLGIGEMRYERSTTERDEVEFEVATPITEPAYYLLLFRDEAGTVFGALSGSLLSPIPPLKVG